MASSPNAPSVHFRGILRWIPCFLWKPGHDLFHTILFWFKCIGKRNNNFHCPKPRTLMYSFAPWVLRWKQHMDFPSVSYPRKLPFLQWPPAWDKMCALPYSSHSCSDHSVKQMSHRETSRAHASRLTLTQVSAACMRNSVPQEAMLEQQEVGASE